MFTESITDKATFSMWEKIFRGNFLTYLLSVALAVFLGSLLIIITSKDVQHTASYFFSRPTDTFSAMWNVSVSAYSSLFQGAVFNFSAKDFSEFIKPLTESLTIATPLITAALGISVAFRAGLFNIGAQGQILIGATLAAYAGFTWQLPPLIHLFIVILFGILGGAFWGGIVGFLKARTGAHEVIVTIMLNYIALNLVLYLLVTPAFQRPESRNPISPPVYSSALYPKIFGDNFRLHAGFLIAMLATCFIWWFFRRSVLGFHIRMLGANTVAAKTAGVRVGYTYVLVMLLAGALAGLSGVAQIAGTEKVLTADVAASFGFDAITVALLGRATPWGTFFSALLFGGFRAGGMTMQAQTDVPLDLVFVVQILIVLFLAAPAFVQEIFRIKTLNNKLENV